MRKIILTGAPHAGKTTTVKRLQTLGHNVVPEGAIEVIEVLDRMLGRTRALEWRKNHFQGFQELIYGYQFHLEELAPRSNMLFLDRGIYDGIAFARHYSGTLLDPAHTYFDVKYDQVFLLDLVLPLNLRAETGRLESETDCYAIHKHLHTVYSELGLEPIIVPVMPVEDRVNFILEHVK